MSSDNTKGVAPKKILFLLLGIHAFVLLFVWLFQDGIWEPVAGYSLRFPEVASLWQAEKEEVKDISRLISSVKVDTSESPALPLQAASSLPDDAADTDTDFSIESRDSSHSALAEFFTALQQCEQDRTRSVNIAYYGDSQVEGDRFSDYLRNKLQQLFGGGGPGLVTPLDVSHMRITVQQDESRDWVKMAAYGPYSGKVEGARYGVAGALFRYRGGYYAEPGQLETGDSLPDSGHKKVWIKSKGRPWLSFRRSRLSYNTVKRFNKVSLYYASRQAGELQFSYGKNSISDSLPQGGPARLSWMVPDSSDYFRFEFKGANSPDIYGVAFDMAQGVSVDNYSMRGSSGTDFVKMNLPYLAQQLQQRGTRMLVLQYGVNVVPYVKDSAAVQYYEKSFLRQLQLLRKHLPGVSILVVGVTDISTKKGTDYVSYPYVEMIRDAQRNAAFQAGCAFWDAYEAMGGHNSMPAWVFNNPPLAAKDFTHLSSKGANILAELLFKAVLKEYKHYSRRGRS